MGVYRISGIPTDIAESARINQRSPQYGHPAHREVATGTGPCRHCLHTFEVGHDERLLFTYQPFSAPGALPQPGPVFVHADGCRRYDELALPADLRALPLVVESHAPDGMVLARRRVGDRVAEAVLDEAFASDGVAFAHLRHGEAGCFIARVEKCHVCD